MRLTRSMQDHLLRTALGVLLILVGFGLIGPLTTSPGLIILGLLLIVLTFLKVSRSLLFVMGLLLLALFVDVRLGALLFPYAVFRIYRFLFVKKRENTSKAFDSSTLRLLDPSSSYNSYLSCREHLLRDATRSKAVSCVGADNTWGVRWHYGPIWFEQYIGDTEPFIEAEAPFRLIIWQPVRDIPLASGWRKTQALAQIKMTGFATLAEEPNAPYWLHWSNHAKRQLKRWRKQTAWEVVEPTIEEFIAAYRRAPQKWLLKFLFIRMLRQMSRTQKGLIHLHAVRRRGILNGSLEAGFAFIDIPEARQSKHFISYMLPSVKNEPVNVGLIDVWFKHCQIHHYRFLDFGVFWSEGDPVSWQGFSRFKSQFAVTYVRYPLPRLRFAGSLRQNFRVY